MQKFVIRENENGLFHIENFGIQWAGEAGTNKFSILVDSPSHGFQLAIPEASIFDLVTHIDLRSREFKNNKIYVPNILKVRSSIRELVVEASSGTLYDFLKESAAEDKCSIHSPLPVAFYWQGYEEKNAVA